MGDGVWVECMWGLGVSLGVCAERGDKDSFLSDIISIPDHPIHFVFFNRCFYFDSCTDVTI